MRRQTPNAKRQTPNVERHRPLSKFYRVSRRGYQKLKNKGQVVGQVEYLEESECLSCVRLLASFFSGTFEPGDRDLAFFQRDSRFSPFPI
jgi:hypothetical protein